MDKQQGFTIIELVIVMVVISIMSGVAYLNWPSTSINLSAQAHQIANNIRYAQSLSMNKGQRFRFVRTSANTYQITNNSGAAISLALGSTTATLNTGITFGGFTNLPSNLIVFNGNGIPYTTTAIPGTALASTATIPITASGEIKIISISPETGRVSVQ